MSNKIFHTLLLVSLFCFVGCTKAQPTNSAAQIKPDTKMETIAKIQNSARVIHVLVALCDNENQGIISVPKFPGNGENPQKTLNWSATYGMKTFFTKSRSLEKFAEFANPKENVLQRIVFKQIKP